MALKNIFLLFDLRVLFNQKIILPLIQQNDKDMEILRNLNTEKIEKVLSVTRFNYAFTFTTNEDGSENIEFDSKIDAAKFKKLYEKN